MNCPKCGSDKLQLTSSTKGKIKKRGIISTLFHLFMIFITLGLWIIVPIITSGSKGKIKTYILATCMDCGYSAPKNKFMFERVNEDVDASVDKDFYKRQWFMWLTLIFFAPVGIFLMYKYNTTLSDKVKKGIAIGCGIFFVLAMISGGTETEEEKIVDNNSTTQQEEKVDPVIVKKEPEPTDITTLSKENSAFVGSYNHIYRMNTDYTNDDWSYIIFNFQTIKYYDEYTVNNGQTLYDFIVIENVLPTEENYNLVNLVAYFQAYDQYGEIINIDDIYTQTGEEFSEILFSAMNPDESKNIAYVLIGGLDSSINVKPRAVFELNKN